MKPSEYLTEQNELLSDRTRISIMAILAASQNPIGFNEMLEKLPLTKGNLSAHAQKLEKAGMIVVKKEFVGKKPYTSYRCTQEGKSALQDYLKRVESLLKGF